MKKTYTFSLLCALIYGTAMATANDIGISQTSGGPLIESMQINIDVNPDSIYTVYAYYPHGTSVYSSISWSVSGGLVKVAEDNYHVSFRCASGTTYAERYSRYASGRVYLHTTLSDQSVADCECATMCNPNHSTSVLVYKQFDFSANHIIGPDCVLPGDSVTFSVEPWLSLQSYTTSDTMTYYWNIPVSLQASRLYYSADKSSVTFVVSDNIENQTIQCSIGKVNYESGQTPLSKPLSNDVADPIITLGGVPFDPETHSVCLPFGVDSVDLVVTNASPELEYSWNLRAWDYSYRKLTSNGSALRILPTDNMVSIKLSVQNGCSDKEYYYDINRSLSSANTIYLNDTTEHSLCLAPNSNVTLSISGVDAITTFDWHFAANASQDWQVLKNGTSRGTIRTGSTSTTLYVSTAVCGNDSIAMPINVKPLAPTISYSGNTCLTGNESFLMMSVQPVVNADYYKWEIPSAWNIISQNSDSSSVILIPDGSTAGNVMVCAVGCSPSDYTTLQFDMQYSAPIVEVTGCRNINSGYLSYLTLTADNSSLRYNWSVPSSVGQIISDDSHASSIMVRTVALQENGTYQIEVEPQNSCSNNSSTTVNISTEIPYEFYMHALAPGYVNLLCIDTPADIAYFSVYLMTDNGYVQVQSGDSTDIDLYNNEYYGLYSWTSFDTNGYATYIRNGSAKINITTSDGCHYTLYTSWTSGGNKRLAISENIEVSLSPNPATDVVTAYVQAEATELQGVCHIFDLNGKLLRTVSVQNGTNTINVADLPKSMYVIVVKVGDKTFGFKQQIK